jgi:hypothetical protein
MAEGVTSVRLGDLAEAVDREAAFARRSRSEMLRFLVEEALAFRRTGMWKPLAPGEGVLERFAGVVPDLGTRYRVTRDEWSKDYAERVIYEWEPVES